MPTPLVSPFMILYGIIFVSYLNINLHIPGGQRVRKGYVTQVRFSVEDTYCPLVQRITSILNGPVRSSSRSSGSMISRSIQGINVPIPTSNIDTTSNNDVYWLYCIVDNKFPSVCGLMGEITSHRPVKNIENFVRILAEDE